MLRPLFAMIGYVATATVITLALGIGYLWHTERLSDEKVFRMVALLQGVDIEQIAEAERASNEEVPPEEFSMDALIGQQQVLDRNIEAKMLSLQRGRQAFDSKLQELMSRSEDIDRQASAWKTKLQQQEELTTQENFAKVISDLEQVKPAIAKDLLMRWIKEKRMDDVIKLLGRMSETKKAKILKSFATPEELDELHKIHRLMIDSGESKEQLGQAYNDLESIKPTAE